jgi:cellulose synthase/poly-beta-1,6-N-acetylglucosamine synthase-like glycosyltransferase
LNTALEFVKGSFVGCFDADHLPDEGSFERAWRWLSNGYEVVQGHCLVRNAEESFWAKMIAIEFETIYALAHPGRTARDGFGVFGGSNGYWRTRVLQRLGMRGAMLTEDIDSSMRALEEGGHIATDPKLVSRELATTTFLQVWNQRLRWAQGWLQVSMKHCWPMIRSPHNSIRVKFFSFILLFFREIYPWFSMQIIPLLIFWTIRGDHIDWGIYLFIGTSIFTTSIGPLTVLATYFFAHKSVRNPWWFLQFLFFSLFFYTDLKNIICRVALVKQFIGESGWRVTPRRAGGEVKEIRENEGVVQSETGEDMSEDDSDSLEIRTNVTSDMSYTNEIDV